VIALARGEDLALEDPPEEAAISAVTLCGLHHGVLVATDKQRPGRLATLILAERRFAALPVDFHIAPHYGRLVADARRTHNKKLANAYALIAATAAAYQLPLITCDRDFTEIDGIETVIV
jgi:predicted nucleic acid-binding protein